LTDTHSNSDTRHLLAAGGVVTVLGLVTKVFGFFRAPLEAGIFGATRAMDAFNVAKQIPQAFSTWFEAPIRAAMVPLFTRRMHEHGEADAWAAASNLINTLALFLAVLCGVLLAGSGLIVRLLGAGFEDPAAWRLATRVAHVLVFSIAFSVLAVVIGSLQNVYRRQAYPAFGRTLNAIVILAAALVLGPRYGLVGYAYGFLGGAIAAFLLQLNLLWRHRHHYRWQVRPWAPEVREILLVALPLFIGLAGTRIDVVIDVCFASFLPKGHMSCRVYGEWLALQFADIIIAISHSVLLPHFAHLVGAGRDDELRRRVTQAVGGYLLISLPVAALLCAAPDEAVQLVFLWGAFTPEKARLTAILVPIVALAAPAYALAQMLAQAHISAGDTKTPMKIGFVRVGVKLVLSLSLIFPLGIIGLVISSSLSTWLRTVLLWRKLPAARRPRIADLGRAVRSTLPPAVLGGGAAWAVVTFSTLDGMGRWWLGLELVLAAAVLGVVHLTVSWLLADETLRGVFEQVRREIRRRRR
jgi:putative peptidoglycan lipid II flippase